MNGSHPDLGPELRQLAQAILSRLDPAVRLAATRAAASAAAGPGKCQQVWCPVCALAAVVNGEHHPLLGVIAEHSVALLAVVRAVLEGAEGAEGAVGREGPAGPDGPDGGGPAPDGGPDLPPPDDSPPTPGRYQHIPVTVQE
mgnify:CR=1 FL=1